MFVAPSFCAGVHACVPSRGVWFLVGRCVVQTPHSNFGAVYSAIHKESDFLLAVKRLHVEVQSELAELQREINIMQQCGQCRATFLRCDFL